MIHNKELFSCFNGFVKFQIKLGDDYQVKALGKGIVTIMSNQDEIKDILNVYYI